MNIIRLPTGELASFFADRIHVWQVKSGAYRWSGALISEGDAAFASGTGFPSHASAENDGISWAEDYLVRVLMIQHGTQ